LTGASCDSPAITVTVEAGDSGYDWDMVSVFFRLTVRPKRLALLMN